MKENVSFSQKLSRIGPGMTQLIPAFAVIMEVSWVYAWLVWFSAWPTWKWSSPPLNYISCLVLAIGTELATHLSLNDRWSLNRVRVIILSGSATLLALLIRWNLGGGYGIADAAWLGYIATQRSALVIAAIVGVYLIWRGIANGRHELVFSDIYGKFVIGLVATVLLLISWGFVGKSGNIWSSEGVYIIIFFGLGLLTMAMANLEALRTELSRYQESTIAFTRRWMSMLVALVLAIIGVAIALASIFSTNIAGSIFHALSVFGDWVMLALSYILLPFAYVLDFVIYLVRLLIAWLVGTPKPVKMTIPDLSDLQKAAEGKPPVQISPWIINTLKWGFLLLIVATVLFFLIRALVRFWEGKSEKEVEEIHETLWSYNAFKTDLRAILAWLFKWLRRNKPQEVPDLPPAAVFSGGRDQNRRFTVKELYQALLWEGRAAGISRRQSETPDEYRKKLADQLGKAQAEIDALTEAYVFKRYGEVEAEPEKVALLNRLWRVLKGKLSSNGNNS